MGTTILLIEDEKRIAEWTQRYFERAGFRTIVAYDGTTGLERARQDAPDLIVLDLMLPGIDGVEICRRLRAESDVPIIMLTARDTQRDRVNGLEIGADDYIVKPFDPEEVVARAKAVLRRVQGNVQPVQHIGVFELHGYYWSTYELHCHPDLRGSAEHISFIKWSEQHLSEHNEKDEVNATGVDSADAGFIRNLEDLGYHLNQESGTGYVLMHQLEDVAEPEMPPGYHVVEISEADAHIRAQVLREAWDGYGAWGDAR